MDLARFGTNHFQQLFSAPPRNFLNESLRMIQTYLRLVYQEKQYDFLKHLNKEELLVVLNPLKMIKVPIQMDGLWNSS